MTASWSYIIKLFRWQLHTFLVSRGIHKELNEIEVYLLIACLLQLFFYLWHCGANGKCFLFLTLLFSFRNEWIWLLYQIFSKFIYYKYTLYIFILYILYILYIFILYYIYIIYIIYIIYVERGIFIFINPN